MGSIIALLALQVTVLHASGATQEAHHALRRPLTLAEPEGYLRVFLDEGEPMRQALQALLLPASGRQQHLPVPPVVASYASTAFAAFASEQHPLVQQTITSCSKALRPDP